MEKGYIKPTKKSDADNIAKIVLDSLNKIAYYDDAQVVELEVKKIYAQSEPYVDVLIEEISE
jgi:Holliday junction resolvase RusA-like endonuclease